ncbi:MAG: DUF2846 domain-containing protein [Methylobacillus sp.]|jgi:hypothetical protein|nr:DUF2846 domain-containing protein [Methylobacillus sp.]
MSENQTPKKASFFGLMGAMLNGKAIPSPDVMKAEVESWQLPKLPESGKALIYVVRPSVFGGMIKFRVFLDDKEASSEMGYTHYQRYIYFSVAPGEHTLFTKAENWAEFPVAVKANDVIFIKQEPSLGAMKARIKMTKIDDVEGKYLVKTLSPGTLLKTEK